MVLSSARLEAVRQAANVLQQKPVFLDTETTGLSMTDEIIEIAVIDSGGQEIFSQFVKPTQPIPPESTAIHGITPEMVKFAQPWPVVWQALKSLINNKVVAIYNDEFDLRMMRQSQLKYGLNWNEHLASFDVMKCYSQFRADWNPIKRSYNYFKLSDACRGFGIDASNAHRALDDVRLTRSLLMAIAGS